MSHHDIHNELYATESQVALEIMRSVVGNSVDVQTGLNMIYRVQRETRATHSRIERMYRNIENITTISPAR
jgi:hypothetical protein